VLAPRAGADPITAQMPRRDRAEWSNRFPHSNSRRGARTLAAGSLRGRFDASQKLADAAARAPLAEWTGRFATFKFFMFLFISVCFRGFGFGFGAGVGSNVNDTFSPEMDLPYPDVETSAAGASPQGRDVNADGCWVFQRVPVRVSI